MRTSLFALIVGLLAGCGATAGTGGGFVPGAADTATSDGVAADGASSASGDSVTADGTASGGDAGSGVATGMQPTAPPNLAIRSRGPIRPPPSTARSRKQRHLRTPARRTPAPPTLAPRIPAQPTPAQRTSVQRTPAPPTPARSTPATRPLERASTPQTRRSSRPKTSKRSPKIASSRTCRIPPKAKRASSTRPASPTPAPAAFRAWGRAELRSACCSASPTRAPKPATTA